MLELVKLGIPAVVSGTPVEQRYFDENMVMYFEPDNPEDMARALIDLYRNPDKRKQLALSAKRFNDQHSWRHYKRIYYELIDRLCLNSDAKHS